MFLNKWMVTLVNAHHVILLLNNKKELLMHMTWMYLYEINAERIKANLKKLHPVLVHLHLWNDIL